jgi:cyclic lactone autoinducer peptide
MVKKVTYMAASALGFFATLVVSTASFYFVYQGETPAELLSE